jgi:hypothetical protein
MKVSNFANPCCAETLADENRKALTQLIGKLLHDGFPTNKGLGVDPSNEWPGEESVLVPSLSLDRAKLLGAEFGQNAIVRAGSDAVPQIILLK